MMTEEQEFEIIEYLYSLSEEELRDVDEYVSYREKLAEIVNSAPYLVMETPNFYM